MGARRSSRLSFLEVIITLGLTGILSGGLLMAVTPDHQRYAAAEGNRNIFTRDMHNAIVAYKVKNLVNPGDKIIPYGYSQRISICRYNHTDKNCTDATCINNTCINLDPVVDEGFIASIHVDPNAVSPNSGFSVHKEEGEQIAITAEHLGEMPLKKPIVGHIERKPPPKKKKTKKPPTPTNTPAPAPSVETTETTVESQESSAAQSSESIEEPPVLPNPVVKTPEPPPTNTTTTSKAQNTLLQVFDRQEIAPSTAPENPLVTLMAPKEHKADNEESTEEPANTIVHTPLPTPKIPSSMLGWKYYKTIDINTNFLPSGTTLRNFPVLVVLQDADLRSHAQTDGDDIAFTDAKTGTIQYDHEIETFIKNSGELTAWIRIPSISNGKHLSLRMYYGNKFTTTMQSPANVWDNNYKGVWHLDEHASGTGKKNAFQDSSRSDNDGDDHVVSNGKQGKIGNGQQFNGKTDYMDIGDVDITGGITISGWIKPDSLKNSYNTIIAKRDASGPLTMNYGLDKNAFPNDELRFYFRNVDWQIWKSRGAGLTTGWQHIAVTYNEASDPKFYVNGSQVETRRSLGATHPPLPTDNATAQISDMEFSGATVWHGALDELRISNIARSAEWISALYESQKGPVLLEVGAQTPNE